MLRVTIELITEKDRRTLGVIGITNDGTSDSLLLGHYDVILSDEPSYTKDGKPSTWRTTKVKGFRRMAKGPYHLLLAALKAAIE